MHRPTPSTNKTNPDALEIETFIIRPNDGHRVLLGIFREGTEPKFRVHYHDHNLESPNVVTHHDMPLHRDGDTYKMYRHFESYSQVPHTITVRFASEADKGLCVASADT